LIKRVMKTAPNALFFKEGKNDPFGILCDELLKNEITI